jgi:hypothetical protein
MTVKVSDPPAISTWLGARPTVVKLGPDTSTEETVTFEFPVFFTVSCSSLLVPTLAVPKFRTGELALNIVLG